MSFGISGSCMSTIESEATQQDSSARLRRGQIQWHQSPQGGEKRINAHCQNPEVLPPPFHSCPLPTFVQMENRERGHLVRVVRLQNRTRRCFDRRNLQNKSILKRCTIQPNYLFIQCVGSCFPLIMPNSPLVNINVRQLQKKLHWPEPCSSL